jgi:hypothetical protein
MRTVNAKLGEKGVSMKELALFSFCALPFSLKFLAAPILDAVKILNLLYFSIISKNLEKEKLMLSL